MNTIKENELAFAFKLGAWSCIILMLYSLATLLIVVLIGGPPQSIDECFSMLRENRVGGLLRLDLLTMFVMPLYYLLAYSLYLSLRSLNQVYISISFLFIITGVTLFLAAPSVFSYLRLSDAYQAAATEIEKGQIRAAGEAILSTDIWNGTGPRIGGLLVQSGLVIISLLMLRSTSFSKLTAYTGIATHGLDLIHVIIGFIIPSVANIIMGIAGVLYLLWFPLIAMSLFRLSRKPSSVL